MKTLKILLFITLLLCSLGNIHAYEERNLLQKETTVENLKSLLIMDQKWVTYPDYTDRVGWNALFANFKQEYVDNGVKYLDYQWRVVKATDYLEFGRSGNRNVMQDPYDSNMSALLSLFYAELAEGKGRFIDQIINGVFYHCEMTTWVMSAHLWDQKIKGCFPNHEEHVIDLGSASIGAKLSWIYYFLNKEFDKVNILISKRLKHEIQKRILDTYIRESYFWWMAFDMKPDGMVNNWNPTCNKDVLQAFLLLENDKDKLAKAIYRTMISVDKFINYNHNDGGCEEGPSYWDMAAGSLYDYLELLSQVTNGKVSIFEEPMIKNMAEYIVRTNVGNEWVVNFADASAKSYGNLDLIYRFGKAVHSDLMQTYARYQINQLSKEPHPGTETFRMLEALTFRNELKSVVSNYQAPIYTWYPETEFCYMTNKNGFFVASKGGFNDESHNHNDVGTFSLYVDKTPIFIDAGVGTYTRQTFSSERYNIWTMQSKYHNLPMINGIPQKDGRRFKAKNTYFDSKQMFFSTDISDAYPKEAYVSEWIRSYKLDKEVLVIKDAFKLEKTEQFNQINFLTWGKVDYSTPGVIIVEVNGEKVRMTFDKKMFKVTKETIKLTDPRLSNIWGNEIYRVSLNAQQKKQSGLYVYKITKD